MKRQEDVKSHWKKIMNQEDVWDHVTEANIVKGLIEKDTWEEMVVAIKVIKPEKATGSFKV